MITLKSGNSVLKINELGAEMKSLTVKGVEYLWTGNPDIWAPSAPNVFPMTGVFKEDKYVLDGKEYSMQRHGFARFMDYKVESVTENSAVFLLTANDETRKQWPYEFEFRVCYKLTNGKVEIYTKVTNTDSKKMWFSVGSHDGYATPEGIDEYDIIFDDKQTLDHCEVDDGVITGVKNNIITDSDKLALTYDYFAIDALVFNDIKFDSCSLVNRNTGRGIKLEFPGAPVMLLWTKPNAPYICIEPWFGEPSHKDNNYDLTTKENIQSLEIGNTFTFTRIITALEGE